MFDPYHKWLGIPPGKRPPTLYQLLAISESEKDRDVIEAATVRQSAYVRNFQNGPNGDHAAKLLSEISEARDILSDSARRKTYDEKLVAERPKAKPVAQAVKPTAAAAQAVIVRAAPVPKAAPAKAAASGRRSKSAVSVPLLVGIIGVVAVATGLGVYFATRGSGDRQTASTEKANANPKDIQQPLAPAPEKNKEENPPPFGWDKVKVDRPHPGVNPGPPPNFGQPPNFGPPRKFVPPPGLFRGPNPNPPNPAKEAAKNENPPPVDVDKERPRKDVKSKKSKKPIDEGIDGLLDLLQTGNHFERDKAAKQLAGMKVDPEKASEVAKLINDILVSEQHLPDGVYDAAAVWANDETVMIIADKLAARPWVDRNAIRAAGKMKNAKLALPLCALLENFFNWEDATRALQQMGPPAEDRVRALLSHRDPKMRVQVCMILATIGTEKSLPSLRRAAGDKATSVAAKAAIKEITERAAEKKSSNSEADEEKPSPKK